MNNSHSHSGSETEYILEVKNLKTYFKTEKGTVKAVDDVSFKVPRGQTIGIVGESGSGKSVTSLSIMRLIQSPPGYIAGGEIIFNSPKHGKIDLCQLSEKEMREIRGDDISMIFQEPMTSLNPVYTCGYQVAETLLLHQKMDKKEALEKTVELFKEVKISRPRKIVNSYPHEISGGQKQRVMIAMAMACNPKILIADEPTTALDVTVQATTLKLMQDLRIAHDTSVLFITHDLGVIAEVADYVIVMYKGKIVEQGDVWDIFSNPQHPYTKGLLACRPRLDIKLKVLPVINDFIQENEDGTISDNTKGRFKSVGEALLHNFASAEEIKKESKEKMKQEPILQIRNLKTFFPISKGIFGKTTSFVKAVNDVSFDVYPGETIGLVGESGCGKTTLGRTILRLVEPTEGDILFEGERINDLKKNQLRELRKKMQIIFQDPYSSLNPRMTIGQIIMEPMKVNNILNNDAERREKAVELLEKVSLKEEYFYRYPHEFSGGQRQRICIARALSMNPKFLICDESVSALDVSVQAQVLNLLNKLKKEFGFTYIFISHDLSVVKFMSDRIIVMNKGKIEESNFAEEIYHSPQKEYTKKLISAIPKGELEDIRKAMESRKATV